jgi:hypothetical protein
LYQSGIARYSEIVASSGERVVDRGGSIPVHIHYVEIFDPIGTGVDNIVVGENDLAVDIDQVVVSY